MCGGPGKSMNSAWLVKPHDVVVYYGTVLSVLIRWCVPTPIRSEFSGP